MSERLRSIKISVEIDTNKDTYTRTFDDFELAGLFLLELRDAEDVHDVLAKLADAN